MTDRSFARGSAVTAVKPQITGGITCKRYEPAPALTRSLYSPSKSPAATRSGRSIVKMSPQLSAS